MKIYINGKQLDTYAKSVSVKKTNNLWKFGKAEFERTQTISVPATNNNKALLDFADEFRTQSSVARGYVDCLTELDGVVKPARLYVSGYKGGEFSCILTFGEELEILDKKLSDLIDDREVVKILGEDNYFNTYNLYDKDGNEAQSVCITLDYILSLLKNQGVGSVDYNKMYLSAPTQTDNFVGIATGYTSGDLPFHDITINFSRTRTKPTTTETKARQIYTQTLGNTYLDSFRKLYLATRPDPDLFGCLFFLRMYSASGYTDTKYFARVPYYKLPFDIKLTFPNTSASDDIVIYYGNLNSFEGKHPDLTAPQYTVVGDSLKGRMVTIPANTEWGIMFAQDFAYQYIIGGGVGDLEDYAMGYFARSDSGVPNSCTFTMSLPAFSNAILPDITLYQLLQTVAAYKSQMLYFDGSKYTLTDLSNITATPKEYKADIVAANSYEVTDKAFDFAQWNIINWKSGGGNIIYSTQNVHLSYDKTLFSIPFDGGVVKVGVFQLTDNYPAIGLLHKAASGSLTFHTSGALRNGNLQNILENTRQVKIKFRMPYIDFDDVAELDCIRYKGALLQWVDLTWSDGWCTATLQTV